MELLYDRVAGLDVHRDSVAACVRLPGPRGGAVTEKERFKTTTAGLGRLAGWLGERQVALVAMEATGVYWKGCYYALERDFAVWLCNAHHVKNVPGRKTDMSTLSGWRMSRRMGWCARALSHLRRSGSCGS